MYLTKKRAILCRILNVYSKLREKGTFFGIMLSSVSSNKVKNDHFSRIFRTLSTPDPEKGVTSCV